MCDVLSTTFEGLHNISIGIIYTLHHRDNLSTLCYVVVGSVHLRDFTAPIMEVPEVL